MHNYLKKIRIAPILFSIAMLTIFSSKISAQVTIGANTPPNTSAVLDLVSTNKGLLLPRLALVKTTDASPLTNKVAGMVIYNVKDTNDVVKGYYYNDGDKWIRLAPASSIPTTYDNSNDAFVNDATNTMVKLATKSDGSTARDTRTEFCILDNGNVGIGTSSPFFKLEVRNSDNTAMTETAIPNGSTGLNLINESTTGNTGSLIKFQSTIATNTVSSFGTIGVRRSSDGQNQGEMLFNTRDLSNGWVTTKMWIGYNGYVGIGVTPSSTAPSNRLHVYSTSDPLRLEGLQAGSISDYVLSATSTGVVKRLTGVDKTDDAFVNDATNTQVKLGTKADGTTARATGTDFVIKDSGDVGIGTSTATFTTPSNTTSIPTLGVDGAVNATIYTSPIQALTDGATITWNCYSGTNATVTLAGNRTLSITNAKTGMYGLIIVKQDATGSRTLTLPSGSKVINGGAGAVLLTTTANAADILTFFYDGTNYWWTIGSNYN